MGDVVDLAGRRTGRFDRPHPAFFFDLVDPATYLAAERVERLVGGVGWAPVYASASRSFETADRALLEERAEILQLPLVWPVRRLGPARPAMRAACFAGEQSRAAAFVLAVTRLAFCGGFDLDDPDVIAEAAAAADLDLDGTIRAAGDASRDRAMEEGARRLAGRGAGTLPVVRVGRMLFCGERRVGDAAQAVRAMRVRLGA